MKYLLYLLVRSTGKPDVEEDGDDWRLEEFHFDFGLFAIRARAIFKK